MEPTEEVLKEEVLKEEVLKEASVFLNASLSLVVPKKAFSKDDLATHALSVAKDKGQNGSSFDAVYAERSSLIQGEMLQFAIVALPSAYNSLDKETWLCYFEGLGIEFQLYSTNRKAEKGHQEQTAALERNFWDLSLLPLLGETQTMEIRSFPEDPAIVVLVEACIVVKPDAINVPLEFTVLTAFPQISVIEAAKVQKYQSDRLMSSCKLSSKMEIPLGDSHSPHFLPYSSAFMASNEFVNAAEAHMPHNPTNETLKMLSKNIRPIPATEQVSSNRSTAILSYKVSVTEAISLSSRFSSGMLLLCIENVMSAVDICVESLEVVQSKIQVLGQIPVTVRPGEDYGFSLVGDFPVSRTKDSEDETKSDYSTLDTQTGIVPLLIAWSVAGTNRSIKLQYAAQGPAQRNHSLSVHFVGAPSYPSGQPFALTVEVESFDSEWDLELKLDEDDEKKEDEDDDSREPPSLVPRRTTYYLGKLSPSRTVTACPEFTPTRLGVHKVPPMYLVDKSGRRVLVSGASVLIRQT
eukprot:GHVP01039112.1.p1 GENE.GHVP01039112.1~~GHVP01039112.1.p1  ORF type:complete len:522 (+),score=105.18 GHVP01039112.1:964-2529(+)